MKVVAIDVTLAYIRGMNLQAKIDRVRSAHEHGDEMDMQTLANELPLAVEIIDELCNRMEVARAALQLYQDVKDPEVRLWYMKTFVLPIYSLLGA